MLGLSLLSLLAMLLSTVVVHHRRPWWQALPGALFTLSVVALLGGPLDLPTAPGVRLWLAALLLGQGLAAALAARAGPPQ